MMNDSFETAYTRTLSPSLPFLHSFLFVESSPALLRFCSLALEFEANSFHLKLGISTLKAEKGLALQDIIQGIYDFAATVEFSKVTRVYFLDQLAQVEYVQPLSFASFPSICENLLILVILMIDIGFQREVVRSCN
jgi:hypothetical protein